MTLPRTELEALLARGEGSARLDLDLDTVAAHLPLLDDVVAMTANGGALLSELAPYAPPTYTGEAFGPACGTVALRLHRAAVRGFVTTEADDEAREPVGLWMFGPDDTALHRSYLVAPGSELVLGVLRLARRRPAAPVTVAEPVADWPTVDQLALLDSVLVDEGIALHRALHRDCLLGRRIDPRWVADLLTVLCHHGVPVTLAVPNLGCLQTHTGRLDHVEPRDGVFGVVAGAAQFAYSPADVAQAWMVATHGVCGPTPTLALFARGGRCLALVTQLGLHPTDAVEAWREMTGSLPEVGA
jgi:putative heme degradation protein